MLTPTKGAVLVSGNSTEGAREHGRAVLVVTHDPRLLEFADFIVYIEDGALTHEERRGGKVYRMRA
jgi:ABC-type lipoprotein export system ATPase subunit